jgi:hypothetical protein
VLAKEDTNCSLARYQLPQYTIIVLPPIEEYPACHRDSTQT